MIAAGTLKISKLDAARRQLRTAITLWFNGGDPVAVHALVFASYEILHAVSKKRDPNRTKLLFDSDLIREELRSELNIALKQNAYFFKHADRDPEAIIEFNPTMSEGFILFAIWALQLCGEGLGDEESAFLLWTHIHKPHLLTDPDGNHSWTAFQLIMFASLGGSPNTPSSKRISSPKHIRGVKASACPAPSTS